MKHIVIFSSLLIFCTLYVLSSCGENQSARLDSGTGIYLESWETVEKDGILFLVMTASNGIEAAIPSRGENYGSTLGKAEEILRKQDLFHHYALYDSLVANGIEGAELRAADALAWDVHARTLNMPLHELIGTKRNTCIRYGDARWKEDDTPESYAQKVKNFGLPAVKLHIPGAMVPQSYAPEHHRLTVPEIVEYLKVVRESCPDLVLAYDPHPQIAAAVHIDSARIIMEACERYGYTWIEAPLPPDKEYWSDYEELRSAFEVVVQNEEEKITYEEFLGWVNSGAIDQICPAVYTFTDYGLTPVVKMIQWVEDHPEKNITVNLHYPSIEHTHLAFTLTDEQLPYFEAPYTGDYLEHFTKVNLYEKCVGPDGRAIAPEFPGIYDIPWLGN